MQIGCACTVSTVYLYPLLQCLVVDCWVAMVTTTTRDSVWHRHLSTILLSLHDQNLHWLYFSWLSLCLNWHTLPDKCHMYLLRSERSSSSYFLLRKSLDLLDCICLQLDQIRSYSQFYSFCKWYSWEPYQNFDCKSAAITSCIGNSEQVELSGSRYVVDTWSVHGRYVIGNVVGMWSVCGRYVVGMWLVCGQYVVSTWSVHGRYVVRMWLVIWLVCGWYVVGMWSVRKVMWCVYPGMASLTLPKFSN